MDLLFLVAITLKITGTLQKKTSSSDESVENILYYKDCNKAKAPPAPVVQVPFRHEEPPPPKPPECVPKMCCSMSCANTCGQDQENAQPMSSGMQPEHSMISRQISSPNNMPMSSMMQPMMQAMQPNNHQPQPPIIPFNQMRARKKKIPFKQPIMTRRNLGSTRDHIRTLISHDEDLKKILKDLVRVTMQKVDLVGQLNSRRSSNQMTQVNRNARNYYASAVNKKEEEETNRLMEEEA